MLKSGSPAVISFPGASKLSHRELFESGERQKMETSQRSIPTYLALSIFNMLCCCFPLGIAALIYSLRVENASSTGDVDRASRSSHTARTLNIVGIIFGVIFAIIFIVIYVVILSKAP